ncbi:PTB domain-containing engulfment adapter protein 1 isoform X2 [Aplysia californica]|uniref:PTB domain-containing engulfment adapter protein 1 isoform X2 n=1 Tax=Aplysia californica TaxID=6500 RepID=A0ABM1VXZ7_APLCA|nr:PTB domain-containing engulfment adapter protein 1 isoform X2 [Aplysia californica]
MDVAKVAKDYFLSSQSSLLIPNREYGSRKLIHVGITRSSSLGGIKPDDSLSADDSPEFAAQQGGGGGGGVGGGAGVVSPTRPSGLKGLLVGGAEQARNLSLKLKNQAMRSGSKQWLHPPEALLRGHILYTVKFLGECTVEQPKGTEVVKDAIRKMKFSKHIKRAEGQKPPKVDLTVSAEAVKVLDPKSRAILHQYPLHRISYCADDKSDKRMFTFIAKAATSNDHYCYVFDSEKCAEEITLTIGQAFDLAYKQFLEASTTDSDIRKQCLLLQKKVQTLQFENDELKKRVVQLEQMKDRSDVESYMKNNQINDLSSVSLTLRESSTEDDDAVYSTPEHQRTSVVGRRLENLMLGDVAASSPAPATPPQQTNGKYHGAETTGAVPAMPLLSPPPSSSRQTRASSSRGANSSGSSAMFAQSPNNPFAASPQAAPSPGQVDPFGMQAFNPGESGSENELWDIRAGFSRGLSFGADDFSLDDLDPLNQRL